MACVVVSPITHGSIRQTEWVASKGAGVVQQATERQIRAIRWIMVMPEFFWGGGVAIQQDVYILFAGLSVYLYAVS